MTTADSAGHTIGAAPLGDTWGDTTVVWPELRAAEAPTQLQHSLGEPGLEAATGGARPALVDGCLPLAAVLTEFPLAALFGAVTGAHEFTPAANPEHSAD